MKILGLAWLFFFIAPVLSAAEPPRNARFVVNLLDYVSSDYPGAVANGKVTVESEYHEQREFAAAALEAALEIPATKSSPVVRAQIEELIRLVGEKADPVVVARAARAAKETVIQITGLGTAPETWPDLARGKKLFAQDCVICHGVNARGDGPAALSLDPKPADLLGPKMRQAAPLHAFNVIRVGVPGTAMQPFENLTDSEAWDLAFYINSLRFQGELTSGALPEGATLKSVAILNDQELGAGLGRDDAARANALAAIRLHSESPKREDSFALALGSLRRAGEEYGSGDAQGASLGALKGYLEGVEPVEPRLRAKDPVFTTELEEKMLAVRVAIDSKKPLTEVKARISDAVYAIGRASGILEEKADSPWLTFLIAFGIMLREGFEAVLILIALLAVLRADPTEGANARGFGARAWVHAGWIAALLCGGCAWVFSAWLLRISGAEREVLEGVVSGLAVLVLLYMGFWLHSRTEIHRWKAFIDGQVRTALAGGGGLGLATISFMAVFREAFEVVLFLRALTLDSGPESALAVGLGVACSFACLGAGAWALVRYSARIPIRKVFAWCSVLMILLSFILAGKGIHSLQEVGWIGARASTVLGWTLGLRAEVLGVFPTAETCLAQLTVLIVSALLWYLGGRPPSSIRRGKLSAV